MYEFTRYEIQAHIHRRLKDSSLLRPNEFRDDVLVVAWEMVKAGMINYEHGFFNCFGLIR